MSMRGDDILIEPSPSFQNPPSGRTSRNAFLIRLDEGLAGH